MQKSEAIQNHKIKPEEEGYYHLMFTKILTEGKRTRDEYHVVLYTQREYNVFKTFTDKNGLNCTGYDEYEIVHNPKEAEAKRIEAERKAEEVRIKNEKEAAEKKETKRLKDEADKKAKEDSNGSEAEEIRIYLTEKGVKFDARLGLAKLKALKEETEN